MSIDTLSEAQALLPGVTELRRRIHAKLSQRLYVTTR